VRYILVASVLTLSACGSEPSLISNTPIVDDTIPAPLTDSPGEFDRGRVVFEDREQGHCVLCHQIEGLEASFQGNLGPDLTLVGERLTPAQLRLRIVDYQIVRPGTIMPSYYRHHDLYQVAEAYSDQPILTAQQVEDLVVYLSGQKMDEADDG